MIQRKIQGIWQKHGFATLTVMWGMIGTTLGQGLWHVDAPDFDKAVQEMEWQSQQTGREMVGSVIPADVDFFQVAARTVQDGLETWMLEVHVPGALATCIYFDDFHLPAGATLHFHTPEGKYDEVWSEGPVTDAENNTHRRWTNDEVPGDALVMVYRCPEGTTQQATLGMCGVGFFARHQRFPHPWDSQVSRGGSEPCQVDVNCPEGDSWQCEKDAVVKLRITQGGGIYLCSGSMVNNTARDCRQLMLSSFHCADEVEENEWPFFKVQFNYEYFECGGVQSINSRTRTGVIHLTDSDDSFNGQINGSDFLLVEVEDPIIDSWEPFYAGWDASGFNGNGGVGIHHPSGDRKKISTYTNSPVNSNAYSSGAHWRVQWTATETDHGVTEGGSSGSPIFEESHRIIGTLTGGSSYCDYPYAPDYYGKMSYHWDGNNPIPTSMRLKAFLDPVGTGEELMNGSYVQDAGEGNVSCDLYTSCEATRVEDRFLSGLTIIPNPTQGSVAITCPAGFECEHIQWFDAMGSLLGEVSGRGVFRELDLSAWGKGVRYITVTTSDGWAATRRVVVQ